jgi:hypothetical protein
MKRPIMAAALALGMAGIVAVVESQTPSAPPESAAASPTLGADQVARLGKDLTPLGAERTGNADRTIPEWDGGLAKSEIDPAVGYVDPFAADRPLYTITAQNAEQFKEVLSAGHLALFKRDARTFRMNVYPTRRSASYPAEVVAEIAKQAPLVRSEGDHIYDVGRTTVPFPIPANGLQVMWNHVFRWRGGSVERRIIWAPVAPTGKFFVVKFNQNVVFDQQGYMERPLPDRLYASAVYWLSPPSAIGQRAALWEPIDPAGDARARWVFVPQTNDTRRLPSFDHDTLEPFTGGLRTADQNDGWNGSPERYDWRLVGKREMIIGYNAYKLAAKGLAYANIIQAKNVDPELLRYEVHRVWVVEATQREGRRHRYFRRIFYVDEDTWQVAQEEVYAQKGALIRFGDHQMLQYYDVQVPWYAATIHHDMGSGSYLVYGLSNAEPVGYRWGFKGLNSDYLPSNLRGLGLQ